MGPDVHFQLTYRWAVEEGFGHEEAERVAAADVGYDELYPARRSLTNITRHFAPWAWLWSCHYLRRAIRLDDLVLLGWALHCAQDAVAHGTLGEKHLLLRARLGRDPDSWAGAPLGVKRRVEAVSRRRLACYRDTTGRSVRPRR
jgi:hypothetical protein